MNSPSFKLTLSRFMSNYGMLFVLILIVAAFSTATIQEQPVEGRFAGESLAADFVASYNSGSCVVIVSSSVDDTRLVQGFNETMAAEDSRVLAIVKGETPPEVKSALLAALESKDKVKPVAIICSRTTSAYTFYSSIPALSEAAKLVPIARKRSNFLKPSNLNNVPQKMARMAIIAIGMTMVIITAGIDLSVGSLLALAAVSCTLLVRRFGGEDASTLMVLLAFGGGIALCGFMGAISGILTTAFRMPAFIATLAMMLIARGLAKNMADNQIITGMPSDVFDALWSFTIPGTSITILSSIVIMISLYAIAHFIMAKTTLGRHIYAIGGNKEAARLSGVPVNRVLLLVYTITGLMAGIAGVMMATEFNSGKAVWGIALELDVIAAVVVGGTSLMGGQGRILGTLIGCAIIVVIRNGMNLLSLEDSMQMMVMGGVIVLAIVADKAKKGDIPWLNLKMFSKTTATQRSNCFIAFACLTLACTAGCGRKSVSPKNISVGSVIEHADMASLREKTAAAITSAPLNARKGGGLVGALGGIRVKVMKAGNHEVIIPMPQLADTQIPVSYSIAITPGEAIDEYRLREREGSNFVVSVRLHGSKGQEILIDWASIILITHSNAAPNLSSPEQYLQETACAQSGAEKLKLLADQLWPDNSQIDKYAENIQEHIRNMKQEKKPRSIDALGILESGGNWICTANANLAAALLRAKEIPTRSIAVIPPTGQRLEMHRVVEYYDKTQWAKFDPSSLHRDIPMKPWQNIIMAKTTIADEAASMKPRMGAMRGAPYGQELEFLNFGITLFGNDFFWTTGRPIAGFDASDEAVNLARQEWKRFLETGKLSQRQIKAASAGNAGDFLEALKIQ